MGLHILTSFCMVKEIEKKIQRGCNNTVGRNIALHITDLDFIPEIPYGSPESTNAIFEWIASEP